MAAAAPKSAAGGASWGRGLVVVTSGVADGDKALLQELAAASGCRYVDNWDPLSSSAAKVGRAARCSDCPRFPL